MLNEVTRLTKGDFRNVIKDKKDDICSKCLHRSCCITPILYEKILKCKDWCIDK